MPVIHLTAPGDASPPRPSGLDLAVGLTLTTQDGRTVALRNGRGVLFARGARSADHSPREPRGLRDASVCATPDGSFAVLALRVDPATDRVDALVVTAYRPGVGFDSTEIDARTHGISPDARTSAIEADGPGFRLRWAEGGVARELPVDSHGRAGLAGDSASVDAGTRSAEISEAVARDLLDRCGDLADGDAPGRERPARRFPFIEGRADPTIVRWDGRWLFIATDEHFAQRRDSSGLLLRVAETIDDLAHAEDHRILGPDDTLQGCFWAPELHVIGDRLWCLFAPSVGTTEWDGVQAWAMSIAAGEDATDPAAWTAPAPVLDVAGGPLRLDSDRPGISLDMTAFDVGDRSYVAWSQRYTSPVLGDAEIWIAETAPGDPMRLISPSARIVVPEYSWELDEANVVEGAFAIVRGGTVYLIYSGSAVGPTYAVGLVTAAEDADLLDPASWTKLPYPVLDTDPALGEWGPGHAMFTRDENGADLLVYHALASADGRIRHAGVRPVLFGPGGRLVLDAAAPAPDPGGNRIPALRATPPMGWNSWDCYGTTVTEAEVLANAEFMAEHLLRFGWDTVVVDIDWSDPTARSHGYNADAPLVIDEFGRLHPDPARFPSSAGGAGFGPLAERIHALGLRFGIHTMRGIPRRAVDLDTPVLGTGSSAADIADTANVCEWNPDMYGLNHAHPAAQAYYDSTLALYARWGVDFIKADDMLWPYQAADIDAYALAISRSRRPIELSLSPGRDLSLTRLDHLRANATMWRICDDLWDRWEDIEANFARFARWAPHASPDGWPDGDMIPLGRIGIRAERGDPRDDALTPDERVSLMTLWLVARSPLMIGGDLPTSDPATIALFTNADALALLRSVASREVFREDGLVLWSADGAEGERYVAAFNLHDVERRIVIDSQNVGLPARLRGTLTELWTGEPVAASPSVPGSADSRGVAEGSTALTLTLAAHGAALIRHAG